MDPYCSSIWRGPDLSRAAPGGSGPFTELVLLFPRLLSRSFARQSCLNTFLFAGLQVEGVSFHFLDDVFLLHLALETSQRVFEGLALLQSYFCQTYTPPNPSGWTE